MKASNINELEPRHVRQPSLLGSANFISRLEKHLGDYRKGRGNISKNVAHEIGVLSAESQNVLARSNPQAFIDFGAYSTMLPYDRQARFVSQISQHTRTLQAIL